VKEKQDNKKVKIALIVSIILIAIDQITKFIAVYNNFNIEIINSVLKFKLVFNSGIANGIGQNNNSSTAIVSNLIVIAIIIRFIWQQKERMDTITLYTIFIILSRWNKQFYR
jgi:lipoprotein signal peptidase